MRLRLRTLMIAVAALGLVLGLALHIQALVRDEDEFALGILMLEAIGASVLLAIALAVGLVVHLVHKDDTYAAHLRRKDDPIEWPLTAAEWDESAMG